MRSFSELSKIRHDFIKKIRLFFEERDFIEIDTPVLVKNPGLEPHLEYFVTHWTPSMRRGKSQSFFLPTSPEYHLKKALGEGLPRIYEIAKSFRNGESSVRHEPEFTMLEWYRSPGTYADMANDTYSLLTGLAEIFALDSKKWSTREDLTVEDAFKKYCNIDLRKALLEDPNIGLTKAAIKGGVSASISENDSFEDAFNKLVLEKIEPNLGQNRITFLWDYPLSMAALSRRKEKDPLFCERFEVYWNGNELANAFGELTDVEEQKRRFQADQQSRREIYGPENIPPIDLELLNALSKISGPCAGIALGVDRLLQSLLESPNIQDVLLFPKDLG